MIMKFYIFSSFCKFH